MSNPTGINQYTRRGSLTVRALRQHYFNKRAQDSGRYGVQVGKAKIYGTPSTLRHTLFKVKNQDSVMGRIIRPKSK